MAVAQQPHQDPLHHGALADDDPVHLLQDALHHRALALDLLANGVDVYCRLRHRMFSRHALSLSQQKTALRIRKRLGPSASNLYGNFCCVKERRPRPEIEPILGARARRWATDAGH